METNHLKLMAATLIVVCLIVVAALVDGVADWAVPMIVAVVGYVVGNAEFTSRTGGTAPIFTIDKDKPA